MNAADVWCSKHGTWLVACCWLLDEEGVSERAWGSDRAGTLPPTSEPYGTAIGAKS